ncbi:hypothetical protein J437_LFUL004256 [Ladona fulva]|uniref:FLYWCH-type domain-containing protein n=1 Tax=Ladona fulva TaxID=123851 RepID=A0A8K0KDS3_LADFU|nr:hypothetical protein J437_LFUL004256 [Ladona fulva]
MPSRETATEWEEKRRLGSHQCRREAHIMEYVISQKGKPSLIYKGFRYVMKRYNKSGESVWYCFQAKICAGRVIVKDNKVMNEIEHRCVSDIASLEVFKSVSKAKKRAREESDSAVSQIYNEEFEPLQHTGCDIIPQFSSLKATLYRQRNQAKEEQTDPRYRQEVNLDQETLTMAGGMLLKMKAQFESKIRELISEKSSPFLLSDEQYKCMIKETKEAKEKKQKGLHMKSKDYRRLKRFDVIKIGQREHLIQKSEWPHMRVRYFCPASELYEVLKVAHLKLGHRKEKAMETELKIKFCNITREVINVLVDDCAILSQLKQMAEEKTRGHVKRVYGKWTRENMESALREYKDGKIRLNACCKKFKIPKKTFLRHFRGEVRRSLVRGAKAAVNRRDFIEALPIETEEELEKVILQFEACLFGLTPVDVRELFYQILESNPHLTNPFNKEKRIASKKWYNEFFMQNPELRLWLLKNLCFQTAQRKVPKVLAGKGKRQIVEMTNEAADEEESKDTAIHYSFQNEESHWMINPDAQQLPLEEIEPMPQHPSPRREAIFEPKEMQSASRKSHRREEYSNDELSQKSAKKTAFSMALNSITRLNDDHRVFGDFVASSLRNLKSDKIRRKLRLDIQRVILEASMLDHSEQTNDNT